MSYLPLLYLGESSCFTCTVSEVPNCPVVLVVAADHGWALTDATIGATYGAMAQLSAGQTALNQAVRAKRASLVTVDAGVANSSPHWPPLSDVISFRFGAGTESILQGAAMTPITATSCVDTGVALGRAVIEQGDALVLGRLGVGAGLSAACLIATLCEIATDEFAELGPLIDQAVAASLPDRNNPLGMLAALGGFEIGVMAGAMVAAANQRKNIFLDDAVSWAAACLAEALAPGLREYMVASHAAGENRGMRRALDWLELSPRINFGVGNGEGLAGLSVA